MKLMIMPSIDGENYTLFALVPSAIDLAAAKDIANSLIVRFNAEDNASEEGVCLNGKSIAENLAIELGKHGVIMQTEEMVATTICWDNP